MFLQDLDIKYKLFRTEYLKYKKGNKSAARRARKLSLQIEKLLLEYRIESIKNMKSSRRLLWLKHSLVFYFL